MYVRPPSSHKSGMKLPENYSGSAFSKQSPYSEMPPPTRMSAQSRDTQIPQIPQRYDIPTEELRQDFVPPPYFEENEIAERYEEMPREEPRTPSGGASIFSSLLPKANLESHFPFGHGIGSEEILILAVMLMVFLSGNESGEVDSEFILLLGLLLFAG